MALLDIPTPPKFVFDVVKRAFLDEESTPSTHSSQGLSQQLRMQSALDATIDTAPT
jgi:hypothetical protein